MKTLLNQLTNWRCILLGLLFIVAMLLGGAEADGWKEFLISKLIAFAIGALTAYLGKRWYDLGYIDFGEED